MGIKTRIGSLVSPASNDRTYKCYLPKPLLLDPPLDIARLSYRLEKASRALGVLGGILKTLPDQNLFLRLYLKKEAVLSSQIEGTRSSLFDLLFFEVAEEFHGHKDTPDITCYKEALDHGLGSDLPICSRLLFEMHKKLMQDKSKTPGAYRTSQNWIGGLGPGHATFVPPPHTEIDSLMSNLEEFINNEEMPSLIKAALSHAQFETIHPFLDGNGRIGRILITLILHKEGVLTGPYLYLSLYLKQNRSDYYQHLQIIRTTGQWEEWVEFFLKGVEEVADQGVATAESLLQLLVEDREKIKESPSSSKVLVCIYDIFTKNVFADAKKLVEDSGNTLSSVLIAVKRLQELGIIEEIGNRKRKKVFFYKAYFEILEKETYA